MLFKVPLNPKHKEKFHGEINKIHIPEKWEDFAKLCDINTTGSISKFIPYDYQVSIAELIISNSTLIAKGRQLGVSETCISVLLHKACLQPGFNALIFSKTQTDSSLLAMRCKRACESIGIKLDTDNLRDLQITGGGRLRFLNSKPQSSRGSESISFVLYDEAGYIEDLQSIRDAVLPTMSMLGDKGRELFISSPNGMTGLFYELASTGNNEELQDICKRVVNEKLGFYHFIDSGGWNKVFLHYQIHPLYSKNTNFLNDLNAKKRVPWETIQREHNLSFEDSEGQFFTNISLERCWVENVREEYADGESNYIGSLDTHNLGNDFWCFQVWRYDNDKRIFYKVNGFRRNRGTFMEMCNQTIYLMKKFPNMILGVEKNALGGVAFEEITNRISGMDSHLIPVTGENKGGLVSRVRAMIEAEKIKWEKSDPLQKDLENYRQVGGQYRAAIGKNDDEVSSLCMALETASRENLLGAF